LEKEFGAAVVADELNSITWEAIDPEDPFPGLARRILSIPLTGDVDHRLENLRQMARDYRVDGAINPCHWGCRQGTGARGLIESSMREIGVPVLNLEVDCVDQRNFSEGQIRTRLQAFMEMLADRPAAGRA
jgi:benzoyl-CoA reductase/2-hydroxyglutaryl-CoA dehydratase subunit BcrC/BadD/HgdB